MYHDWNFIHNNVLALGMYISVYCMYIILLRLWKVNYDIHERRHHEWMNEYHVSLAFSHSFIFSLQMKRKIKLIRSFFFHPKSHWLIMDNIKIYFHQKDIGPTYSWILMLHVKKEQIEIYRKSFNIDWQFYTWVLCFWHTIWNDVLFSGIEVELWYMSTVIPKEF